MPVDLQRRPWKFSLCLRSKSGGGGGGGGSRRRRSGFNLHLEASDTVSKWHRRITNLSIHLKLPSFLFAFRSEIGSSISSRSQAPKAASALSQAIRSSFRCLRRINPSRGRSKGSDGDCKLKTNNLFLSLLEILMVWPPTLRRRGVQNAALFASIALMFWFGSSCFNSSNYSRKKTDLAKWIGSLVGNNHSRKKIYLAKWIKLFVDVI